MPVDMALYH